MSVETRPFFPLYNQTQYTQSGATSALSQQGSLLVSVTVAAGAAAVSSTQFPGTTNNADAQIQVANTTDKWAFVNFGAFGNIRAATVTDYPIAPGAVQIVSVDPEVSGASVILTGAPGGSASVIFTRGSGT